MCFSPSELLKVFEVDYFNYIKHTNMASAETKAVGYLLPSLAARLAEAEVACRTGVAVGTLGLIADVVLTPDPEMEVEEVERKKRLGQAEEDDVFRDLRLGELLGSETEGVEYKEWFAQHTSKVAGMVTEGMRVVGVYVYAEQEQEVEDSVKLIDAMVKTMLEVEEFPFAGRGLFLLVQ